jgi:hypothetical protein
VQRDSVNLIEKGARDRGRKGVGAAPIMEARTSGLTTARPKSGAAAKDDMEDPSVAYPTPDPVQGSFDNLKERIKAHYELCSDYYYSLW